MTVSSWDDYPVHQTSEFVAHPGTSDRNFYDRYYFNLHGSSDELFAVFGLGQYPNLGVTDAFIDVRYGDRQYIVRASTELLDRASTRVGPIRVEVLNPLQSLRVIVEPTEHSVAMDVTWEGAMPAHQEPRQYLRNRGRVVFDTQRFAQTGRWTGSISIDGVDHSVTPDRWSGTRDRSWGVRPVGEREPDGIQVGQTPMAGMWNYFPILFDDHSMVYMCHERDDGKRLLEEATRIWHDGRPTEWLGRPEWVHQMVSGTRLLEGSTILFPDAPGGPIELSCKPLLTNWVSVGTGYGIDADWRHGMYQGVDVVQGLVLEVGDIQRLGQYGIVDHIARFSYDNQVGYGLYEHGFFGPFTRMGLVDSTSLAP